MRYLQETIFHSGWVGVWLFLLGATLGTLLDALHVYTGVERYPMPTSLGVAWWVPLLFGVAAIVIGYSHPMVKKRQQACDRKKVAAIVIGYSHPMADALLQHRRPKRRLVISLSELTWLLLAYLIAASMLEAGAKVGILVVIYLNFWLLAGRTWQNLLLGFVTAVTGTLIEMILVAAGVFSYIHPDIFGIPYWLPCMYACASLAVGDVGRSLMSLHTRTVP